MRLCTVIGLIFLGFGQWACADTPKLSLSRQVRRNIDLGRYPEAIRLARQALEEKPDQPEIALELGRILLELKQYTEARKYLEQATANAMSLKQPKQQIEAWRLLIDLCQQQQDWRGTEAACRELLKILQVPSDRFQVLVQLGQALNQQNAAKAAAEVFDEAIQLHKIASSATSPNEIVRVQLQLAKAYQGSSRDREALQLYEAHLPKVGTLEDYENYAELLSKTLTDDRVANLLSQQASEQKQSPARWVGLVYQARAEFNRVDQEFRESVWAIPNDQVVQLIVQTYFRMGRVKSYLAFLDSLFLKLPDEDTPQDKPGSAEQIQIGRWFAQETQKLSIQNTQEIFNVAEEATRLGVTYHAQTLQVLYSLAQNKDQLLQVLQCLRNMPRNSNDNRIVWMQYEILYKLKMWKELVETGQMYTRVQRGRIDLGAISQMAVGYAELGQGQRAIRELEQVDGRIYIRNQKARIYMIMEDYKKAIRECQDIYALDKPNPDELRQVRLTLADAYFRLGDRQKGEAELRAALEDDPNDVLVLNNLGYNLADQGRKLEEAERMIRRAIDLDAIARNQRGDLDEQSGTYLDSLGWVLFRRGQIAEAKNWLLAASQAPDSRFDAVVWDHLGDVQMRLREDRQARQSYQRAIELYQNSSEGREKNRLKEVQRKLELLE